MRVSKLSKPFYLGAIALFATSALAFTHPAVSHASEISSISSNLATADSQAPKDAYGLTIYDYLTFDHNAIANSSMPDDYKAMYFGLSDGIYNRTRDTNYNNTSYQNGYIVGQTLAQGWITAQKYGNKVNDAPYINSFNDPNTLTDKQIAAVYFGYLDGSNSQRAKNNHQTYRLQYLATKDEMTKQLYIFGFLKGTLDIVNNVSVTDNNQNQTPFGFNYSHLSELNMMRSIEHLPAVSISDAPTNALNNTDTSTYYDGGNIWSTANYTLGTPSSIMTGLFNTQNLTLPKSSMYVDITSSARLLNVTTTNETFFKQNPFLDFTSDAKPTTNTSDTSNNTLTSTSSNTTQSSNTNVSTHNTNNVTSSSNVSNSNTTSDNTNNNVTPNPVIPNTNVTKNTVSDVSSNVVKPVTSTSQKSNTTTSETKPVTKPSPKVTTVTKHKTNKVTKKRIKKAPKKIRKGIPHAVYAKHRTGVHSSPQFNHGKTYFVETGHKFHVYYKISDGHGNWRYNVGYHKFITTLPGSITKHYVKPIHHIHHHIKKHHHRR